MTMTDKLKDGGPAFPRSAAEHSHGGHYEQDGMSIRDWFAGHALSGQLAFSPHDSFDKTHQPEDVAVLCYRFADAMIAARKGGA
jgi:hypothetical protein